MNSRIRVLVSLAVLLPLLAPELQALTREERRHVRQSVVQIYGIHIVRGNRKLDTLTWWGSGTVLNTEGWVLTNFHVAFPFMNDSYPAQALFVCYNEDSDQPAIPLYRAKIIDYSRPVWWQKTPGEWIDVMDFAILKCAWDMTGQELSADADNFAHKLLLGDSDSLELGDQMTAIGYPDYASGAPTWLDGTVSDIQIAGSPRVRLALGTSAAISHGNSGGAAIDASGKLVGVPTFGSRFGKLGALMHGYVLPVNNVKDMIARTVPNTGLGAVVRGRVTNVVTGAGVPGAVIYVLRPGSKTADLARSSEPPIIDMTQSGPDGRFRLPRRLPVSKKYSVAVLAEGYERFLRDDFFDVRTDQTLDAKVDLIPLQHR